MAQHKRTHCECGEQLEDGRCPQCVALARPAHRRGAVNRKLRLRSRNALERGLYLSHVEGEEGLLRAMRR
jgi:hypothetical protein